MLKKEALVIVAHPDDETIWMGGTILKNKKWNWTVVSLCRAKDKDRAPKFREVCKKLGAKSIISDLDDENLRPVEIREVMDKINSVLPRKKFDYVYTHGENGEYGHIRHREIHGAVKEMVSTDEIKCKNLKFFSYIPGNKKAPHNPSMKIPIPNKKADDLIKLNKEEHEKKVSLVADTYGFNRNIFEVLACNKSEAFTDF